MSEANDLLNSLSETEYASYSKVTPINDVLLIDAETRTINVPSTEILFGVETDKDVERKYFKCSRIVGDNVDLSTLSLRVHYQNANGEKDKYIVEDVKVVGDYITFSWLLRAKVLRYKGVIQFTVVAVSVNQDGTLNKEWNTTLASGNALEGLEVEDLDYAEEEQARDVLAQLLQLLETRTDESVAKVQNEASTQMKNIEDKGAEVLATIPQEYQDTVDELKQNTKDIYDLQRTKASAIVGEVVGETIYVQDAAEQPPVELSVFGKTEQSDYTKGYQLFDASRLESKSGGGCDIVNHGDGSFTITGSGTISESIWTFYTLTDEEYSKIMQVGNILYVNAMPITNPFIFFGLYDSANANIASLSNRQGITEKLTITQDLVDRSVMARFYIIGNPDSTITPGTIKPMYYMEGDGTWERFSGGKAGPNPENRFEMKDADSPYLYKVGHNLINMADNSAYVDGKIKIEYTGYNSIGPYFDIVPAIPGQTYTFSYVIENGGDRVIVQLLDSNYEELDNIDIGWGSYLAAYYGVYGEVGDGATFTIPKDTTAKYIRIVMCKMNTCGVGNYNIYSDCQLEYGPVATGYKEYSKETLSIPYTLKGVRVSDGGNYIDSNGQMWYGDEVDLERGVYIPNVCELVFDGSSDESWYLGSGSSDGVNNRFEIAKAISPLAKAGTYLGLAGYCDAFRFQYVGGKPDFNCFRIGTDAKFSVVYLLFNPDTSLIPFEDIDAWKAYLQENPIKVYIPITNPVEIQLTPEEIAAYKKLLLNNPINTLYNSARATMRLRYGLDTKKYVDSRSGSSITTRDEITLSASGWTAHDDNSYYTQVVDISDITENTKIDLNLTPEQIIDISSNGITMFAVNDNMVVTVYASGDKPSGDMTIQIAKSEVVYV